VGLLGFRASGTTRGKRQLIADIQRLTAITKAKVKVIVKVIVIVNSKVQVKVKAKG
jgi:hypothetical protein